MREQDSVLSRLLDRVFPRMPDFYHLFNQQCDLLVKAMQVTVDFVQSNDPDKARRVRELEQQGKELKRRSIDILNKAFSTPMDREDIYTALERVNHIVSYTRTVVRELELLELAPDKHMVEMMMHLKDGSEALQRGFAKLQTTPLAAETDAEAARQAERLVEETYRQALVEMFQGDRYHQLMDTQKDLGMHQNLGFVIDLLKHREVYRHLSNAGDRVAHAGEILHDIIVKIA